MRKGFAVLLIMILIGALAPASALVERGLELNAAFSMLEEGNPFLARYNEITGADIQAR